MDYAADLHDLILLLNDNSEENAFEEGNTLNTMALFEISKPLQSTIIFESDNESSYSSNENDIEPKRQVKRTKQCSKKSKKTNTTGKNLIRVNEDDILDETENKYFQQCNENIVFDVHKTVVASNLKEATSTAELKNKSCYPIVGTQTIIKGEFDLIDINTHVEEKNGYGISNPQMKIKLEPCTIKCEPSESHKYSLKNVEYEHCAKNVASFNEKNTSNSEDKKIQNLIQEKNSLTSNCVHDNSSLVRHIITNLDNKKEPVGSIANVKKNSNFVDGQSNTIAADFGNNLKDIPTSINYTDKNIVKTNPGHDSKEKNRSINLLVKEILNIMYDVIKFDEYKKALGKENIRFPYHISEQNVIQEYKKFLISTLTKSWDSVVSRILDKEDITHSFVAYILNKGKLIANDEGNSFNSHYFMGILKYFLKLNTIAKILSERKLSKTNESYLHDTRPMANSQNTHFNESIALMNENSIPNNGRITNNENNSPNQVSIYTERTNFIYGVEPVANKQNAIPNQTIAHNLIRPTNHNDAHSNHTAVETNINVLNNSLLNEMLARETMRYNIDIDKNNVQSIKNVVMENSVTASEDTHAFNVNSPIAVVRTASNNLFAQPNTSLLSTTEKNVLPNASDKYRNILHVAPTYRQRFPYSSEHRQPPPYILPYRQPPPNTRPYRQPPPYTLPYRQPLPYTRPYRQPPLYTRPYGQPPNIPAQAVDRQYQYENSYNPKIGIPGHVKENLFRFASNYQTTSQTDRNIVPNQSNYIPNNYVLHPDVSYRPRHPTSVQSNSTYGATRNSQLRSELLKKTRLHTCSKSLRINRTENPARSYQPIPQTQTISAHATSQDYELNSTNYDTTTQTFQTEILTINPEQARSSTSRDSGFMSPSTSYEQTVSSPPDTASTTTISQSASLNADNIYTTTCMYPCIVCGKITSQKCSRCMIVYLCSNVCSERDSSFHSYLCETQ